MKLKYSSTIAGGLLLGFVLWSGFTTIPRDALSAPLVLNELVKKSDVIIVLGSGTKKQGDHMTAQGRQRVVAGILTFRQNLAPQIIMAGGYNKKTKLVEADVMFNYAVSRGLDGDQVLKERTSLDTWQNAENSLALMKQAGWKSAIVVTSPYHTWRACRMFRKLNVDVRCVAAPFSLVPADSFRDHLTDTRAVIREYGAIVYNWLKGQI